ncbi:hypothetical protein Godav_028108 [Gossypium davidsonii]|uniref:DC1 domain-containing protein n=1 Tax=Gossypium davidsonii TaxID=34287 RepID=A0A7J8RZ61_GOSDV|nr:hypothetical protein [Gossypium davidsonii]
MHMVVKIAMTPFLAAESVVSVYSLNPLEEMLLDLRRMEENFNDGSLGLEMILRVSFHPHLLVLNDDDDDEIIFMCDKCEELCIGSRYNYKLCSFNLDSKCAALSVRFSYILNVFHYHPSSSTNVLHPLVLTTLVIEDDYEEYYCDTCEAKRNPEHDIYYFIY